MLGQSYAPAAATHSRFFLGMAIAAAAVVFGGFAPTYYLRPLAHAIRYPSGQVVSSTLPLLIHGHALVSTAWLLLLLVQTSLVAADRVDSHRKLGVAGAVTGVALVALGVLTALRGAKDGWNPGGPFHDSIGFLAVTLGDVLLFAAFVAAALYYRRRPDWHKRFMLLGTLAGLMWPAITRMPFVAPHPARMFGLLIALVVALPVHDYVAWRRLHPASTWGAIAILTSFPLRVAVGNSATWHHLASRMISEVAAS
jgi:hypothetical protein